MLYGCVIWAIIEGVSSGSQLGICLSFGPQVSSSELSESTWRLENNFVCSSGLQKSGERHRLAVVADWILPTVGEASYVTDWLRHFRAHIYRQGIAQPSWHLNPDGGGSLRETHRIRKQESKDLNSGPDFNLLFNSQIWTSVSTGLNQFIHELGWEKKCHLYFANL